MVGLVKAIGKAIFFFLILTFTADLIAITVDRILVEVRVWSVTNDMEEAAEENNGIPEVLMEEYISRLERIQERSFLVEEIQHNMQGDLTVGGETFETIGTQGTDPTSPVRVYNYGDTMDVVVAVTYRYGTVIGGTLERRDSQSDTITVDDISDAGRGNVKGQTTVYWTPVTASDVLK